MGATKATGPHPTSVSGVAPRIAACALGARASAPATQVAAAHVRAKPGAQAASWPVDATRAA